MAKFYGQWIQGFLDERYFNDYSDDYVGYGADGTDEIVSESYYSGHFSYEYDSQGNMTKFLGGVVYGYEDLTGISGEEYLDTAISSFSLDFSEFRDAKFNGSVLLPKIFAGNDILEGYGSLNGYAGNDVIRSVQGGDTLTGGTGDDIYYISPKDHIIENPGEGYDRVVSSVTFSLKGADLEGLVLSPGSGPIGAIGNELNNKLVGNEAGNKMQGMEGNDALYGGLGRDALYGGIGNDTFVFDTALGSSNVDVIYDFANAMGDNDTIRLDHAVFTALTATGRLAESAFATIASSSSIVSADAHILYDKTNGGLYYDPDGGTASGRIVFAVLHNHADVTFHDFLVV